MPLALGRHGANFWLGCRDSLSLAPTLHFLFESARLRSLFWKLFLLNGLILCGSLWFFQYVGHSLSSVLHQVAGDPGVVPLFLAGFSVLFKLTWMWPVRLLAFAFNCVWSVRVFDEATRVRNAESAPPAAQSYDRLLRHLTEYICQFLLLLFFLVEATAWSFVPFVGLPVSFAFFCWLHAFYAFDYRWAYENKSLQSRVKNFELRWDYFLGFGTPMTLLYFLLCEVSEDGPFFAFGATSFLFPIHVLLTLCLTPQPAPHHRRLDIFSHFAMRAVDAVWYCTPLGGR
eukprot:EG_transcript_16326